MIEILLFYVTLRGDILFYLQELLLEPSYCELSYMYP